MFLYGLNILIFIYNDKYIIKTISLDFNNVINYVISNITNNVINNVINYD